MATSETVYVTDRGTKVHASKFCAGEPSNRTAVSIDEADGEPCSICGRDL